jgi:hypothetical protein
MVCFIPCCIYPQGSNANTRCIGVWVDLGAVEKSRLFASAGNRNNFPSSTALSIVSVLTECCLWLAYLNTLIVTLNVFPSIHLVTGCTGNTGRETRSLWYWVENANQESVTGKRHAVLKFLLSMQTSGGRITLHKRTQRSNLSVLLPSVIVMGYWICP